MACIVLNDRAITNSACPRLSTLLSPNPNLLQPQISMFQSLANLSFWSLSLKTLESSLMLLFLSYVTYYASANPVTAFKILLESEHFSPPPPLPPSLYSCLLNRGEAGTFMLQTLGAPFPSHIK